MQAFTRFLLLLAVALVLGAVLSYPVWLLVELIARQPIHRIMHRCAMLVTLVGLVWLTRRMQLSNRKALGYGQTRRHFLQQLLRGWLIGAAIMVPLMVMLYQLDVRIVKPRFDVASALLLTALAGAASGLVVAVIEETFFRGVLFSAVERESGSVSAIILPSLLYAALHFLDGRLDIPDSQVDWASGFAVLSRIFVRYSEPSALVDSFLALLGVGLLLAVVRWRTGSIAASIGMHSAWVCIIAFVRKTSQLNPDAPANWLVGTYDGVIGWAAVGWIAVFLLLYLRFGQTRPMRPSSA